MDQSFNPGLTACLGNHPRSIHQHITILEVPGERWREGGGREGVRAKGTGTHQVSKSRPIRLMTTLECWTAFFTDSTSLKLNS